MKNYKSIHKIIATTIQLILSNAKRLGRFFGTENRPKQGESLGNYIHPIIKACEVLYQTVKMELGSIQASIKNEIQICKASLGQLYEKRQEFKRQKNVYEHMLGQETKYSLGLLLILCSLLFLILGADTFFNGTVFQIFGNGFITSILMGLGFSLALLLLFHAFKKTIELAKNDLQKQLIVLAWIVFLTAIFYFLGDYRTVWLIARGGSGEISTIGYILFNWLFVLAGAVILSKIPHLHEIKLVLDNARAEDRVRVIQKKIDETQKKINKLEERLRCLEQELENLPWYENDLKKLIESTAKEAVSEFISENLKARTDGSSSYSSFNQNDIFNPQIPIA